MPRRDPCPRCGTTAPEPTPECQPCARRAEAIARKHEQEHRNRRHRLEVWAGRRDDCPCDYCRGYVRLPNTLHGPALRRLRELIEEERQRIERTSGGTNNQPPPAVAILSERSGIPERTFYRLLAPPPANRGFAVRISVDLADRILTHALDAPDAWHTDPTLRAATGGTE